MDQTGRPSSCTAFHDAKRLASGPLADVAVAVSRAAAGTILVFDDLTGRVVDLDLRGTETEIRHRYAPSVATRGRGRPRLGVVGKEVTLLPRHWDWLDAQPGGASVALRKLVEEASRSPRERQRAAHEAGYRAMHALAGDLPGFEEASRALFAGKREAFARTMAAWPADIRVYVTRLAFGP